ncbi:MAG: hypothetical protein DME33_05495 [Verrucomicrobia bacterium]|nr:MAG: hypothetical protein DME33_05495 [Verrucomicrobiota bacterium]
MGSKIRNPNVECQNKAEKGKYSKSDPMRDIGRGGALRRLPKTFGTARRPYHSARRLRIALQQLHAFAW